MRLLLAPGSSSRRQRRLHAPAAAPATSRDPIAFLVFLSKEPIAFFFSVQVPLCKSNVGENLSADCFTKQHLSPDCFTKPRLTNKRQNLSSACIRATCMSGDRVSMLPRSTKQTLCHVHAQTRKPDTHRDRHRPPTNYFSYRSYFISHLFSATNLAMATSKLRCEIVNHYIPCHTQKQAQHSMSPR